MCKSFDLLSWGVRAWVLSLAFANCGQAQKIQRPEDQPISLYGTIRLIHGFGPPGYGETRKRDAHVTYWAIETIRPLVAIPDQKDFDCTPSKRMKLFFPGLELQPLMQLPAARWKDRRVTISGKIHCADTAGEMTSIYMDVDNIGAFTEHQGRHD
jgi:hypothetical protein